jgi:hypothetical protein
MVYDEKIGGLKLEFFDDIYYYPFDKLFKNKDNVYAKQIYPEGD